jgi:hypothetical protein
MWKDGLERRRYCTCRLTYANVEHNRTVDADNALHFIFADSLVSIRLVCLCLCVQVYDDDARQPQMQPLRSTTTISTHHKAITFTASSSIMTTQTLLSLPREIRNIIYSYLFQELVVDWGYRPSPFPLGGHALARLHVREAPLSSVLLSCAQIYHEYRQDKRCSNLSVQVNVEDDLFLHLQEGQPTNHLRARKVLELIVRVDLVLCSVPTWGAHMEDVGDALDVLEPSIALLAPRLQIMRLVVLPLTQEQPVQYFKRDLKSVRARGAHGSAAATQTTLRLTE